MNDTNHESRITALENKISELTEISSLSSIKILVDAARSERAKIARGEELTRILTLDASAKYPAIEVMSDLDQRDIVLAAGNAIALVADAVPPELLAKLRRHMSADERLGVDVELADRAGQVSRQCRVGAATLAPGRNYEWRPAAFIVDADQFEALTRAGCGAALTRDAYNQCWYQPPEFRTHLAAYQWPRKRWTCYAAWTRVLPGRSTRES